LIREIYRRAYQNVAAAGLLINRGERAQAAEIVRRGLEQGESIRASERAQLRLIQATMQQDVGPFRTEASLKHALEHIAALRREAGRAKPPAGRAFDSTLLDWLDLDTMTRVGEIVSRMALERTESRGAHQREDFPAMDEHWQRNQLVTP
jgi:succinate dehydrogenase / fumarate reductase, flavoprotein subunit